MESFLCQFPGLSSCDRAAYLGAAQAGTATPSVRPSVCEKDAVTFMKSVEGNFLVWLHFMDTHWPFSFPDYRNPLMKYKILKACRTFSYIPGEWEYDEETWQLIEEMYDTSIRRLDLELQALFKFLEKENLLANSYIFVTSDHGEQLLERGALGHVENISRSSPCTFNRKKTRL